MDNVWSRPPQHQFRGLSEAEIGHTEEVDGKSIEVNSAFSLGSLRRRHRPDRRTHRWQPGLSIRVCRYRLKHRPKDPSKLQNSVHVLVLYRRSSLRAILPSCISALVHKRDRCVVSAALHTSSSLIGVACRRLCSARPHKESA